MLLRPLKTYQNIFKLVIPVWRYLKWNALSNSYDLRWHHEERNEIWCHYGMFNLAHQPANCMIVFEQFFFMIFCLQCLIYSRHLVWYVWVWQRSYTINYSKIQWFQPNSFDFKNNRIGNLNSAWVPLKLLHELFVRGVPCLRFKFQAELRLEVLQFDTRFHRVQSMKLK